MGWWWVARDERNSGSRARPAWPQQRVTKHSHVRSGSFTGRYERARRALRAERRAALLGFPLPAAQRVDARYENTYRCRVPPYLRKPRAADAQSAVVHAGGGTPASAKSVR